MSATTQSVATEAFGRQASRSELELPPALEHAVQCMSTPDGPRFAAWTGLHLALWAAELAAVVFFRGHLVVQAVLSILLGSQLHALTVLQHDCGHRSAFRSPTTNLWVGRCLAWFIYMPFTTFTELHRRHHGFLGDALRDPDEWFYRGGRHQLFLRECLFLPRFIYLSLTNAVARDVRRRVIHELAWNTTTYVLLAAGLLLVGAWDVLVFGFALPMLFLAIVYNPISRGYEHYPLACMALDDVRRTDLRFNTITVTSRMVGLLWANINYHVEHHMYARVPFYRLPKLHELFGGKSYLMSSHLLTGLGGDLTSYPSNTGSRTADCSQR